VRLQKSHRQECLCYKNLIRTDFFRSLFSLWVLGRPRQKTRRLNQQATELNEEPSPNLPHRMHNLRDQKLPQFRKINRLGKVGIATGIVRALSIFQCVVARHGSDGNVS
jgi:hypothetical protein